MRRVGILGGTFDPVHNGHMIIARAAMEQYGLSEVLIMTGGNPPHKKNDEVTPAQMRHEMVKLAAAGEAGLVPFDYEVHKKTYSYTAQTLTELKQLNPDTEYYFIVGEDSLEDLPKWYMPEVVAASCILLVYQRGESSRFRELVKQRRKDLDADIRVIDAPIFEISSTEIRRRVRSGKSVKYFVPEPVVHFIEANKLYID